MAEATCDHDGIRKGALTSALYGRSEAQRVVNHTKKAHCESKGRLDAVVCAVDWLH